MGYREKIRDTLVNDSAVAAIVGQQVYAMRALQTTVPPYILTSVASHVHENTLEGIDETTDHARVRCDLFGPSYKQLTDLEEAVRNAIHATPAFSAQYIFGFELYEDDTQLYHLVLDFSVWHVNL